MSYTLFCAILGQETAFLVNIDETQTVDELKKHIKAEEPALASFATDTLTLYKVDIDISNDDTYEQVMRDISQNKVNAPREELTNPSQPNLADHPLFNKRGLISSCSCLQVSQSIQ